MSKVSLTQSGVYVSVLSFLVEVSNLNITDSEIESFVTSALVLVGLVVAWYGRYRKGDLTKLGTRK